jgi:hypothetical protein
MVTDSAGAAERVARDVEAPLAEQATVGPLTGDPAIVGVPTFAFAAVGAYVFAGSLSAATGGKPFPLGRPVIT